MHSHFGSPEPNLQNLRRTMKVVAYYPSIHSKNPLPLLVLAATTGQTSILLGGWRGVTVYNHFIPPVSDFSFFFLRAGDTCYGKPAAAASPARFSFQP